ncbi:NAD-dependent epimerase/dehydratase family protein [Agromyces aurantiacus]|uniref:NAD-dependent epimerase/dehydratase family protein n=1 Tax=Agromyces aurantiacus TaxID=165814 RepID=A0ABV9R3L3_9MICO|nr:NAD-dependent epimerase/dehydratase family protein [Agromyces aurantiacus]MBM7503408.1 nucleoside-diphosphate-sugar epimerase [Agromyces aurantiacus]
MRTLLTGGTGFIGSAVLDVLVGAGHEVRAVVRSADAAEDVARRGATPARVDLSDAAAVAAALADVDALVHTAAPADGADALNAAVVDAAIGAFADGRRVVLTSGVWVYGEGEDLTEDHPLDPPELVAWRVPIEERLLASSVDARVIVPGVVYGRGRGIVPMIADGPRTPDGAIRLVGDGSQHWTLVHVDDLARLYLAVLEHDGPLGRVIASDGSPTTVRAIVESVAGPAGVVPETAAASHDRFGAAFADALLLDQAASGAAARALGWTPEHRSVLDELARSAERTAA